MLVYKLQRDRSKNISEVKKDVTEKVFSRNIREYTCDFELDEIIDQKSTTGEKDAEDKVMKRAEKFLENIEKNTKSITDSNIPGRGSSHIIEKEKGIIEITVPKIRGSSKAGGSKSGTGSGENTVWDNATYGLMSVNSHQIVVRISTDKIALTCQSSPVNGGVFQAHKILNPGKLISILFGEKNHQEVKQTREGLFKQGYLIRFSFSKDY